jgi:hypothetical protein
MRILIVTSCTGEKAEERDGALKIEDFRAGGEHVRRREKDLCNFLLPAGEMYTGQQHVRLMRGVNALRNSSQRNGGDILVDLYVLSAGYGLISEFRKIAPYECTFAGMKAMELRHWADRIKVPQDFRRLATGSYDFGLVLLGDNYLHACALTSDVRLGGLTLVLCGKGQAKKLPRISDLRVLALSNSEAKRFSCGLVGLKGELVARLLKKLGEDKHLVQKLSDPASDVLAMLDEGPRSAPVITNNRSAPKANPRVDTLIRVPRSWWDKPHRKKLRYFIPEWDDLVDPDFDFLTDTHSGGTGDWSNQVYAHQLYPEPNYDGILMSRAVAEKSRTKRERINALGVHRFLRVPRELPVMGDCGAFDYIMQEVPPYTTEDVLDYYTRLDFDYGVSVDHLIVAATEQQKTFRYELTIHNAEDFLKQHRKAGLKWEPIGAIQGWNPESYARAALRYVKMGYSYLALGGLVRTTSRDILKTVHAVRNVIPAHISLHLFGVARLDWIRAFQEAGINSVDSASYLRQAWMRIHQSYASFNGSYAALRIPEAGKSFRAKHMERLTGFTDDKILKLERDALAAVRAYGQHNCSIETCLEALLAYDQFVTKDRVKMTEPYRRTLTDRPWETCDCEICKKSGIEVVIFRGNNRNRRRGFHNTYIFYRLIQRLLNGESVPFLALSRAAGSNETELAF